MTTSSRYIALLISLLLIGSLFYFFTDLVSYALIAWVLSMIGQPLMKFFKKYLKVWKFQAGPNTAAILTLLTFFLVIGLMIGVFVPPIVEQVNNLSEVNYAAIAKALEQPMLNVQHQLARYGLINPNVSLEVQLQNLLTNSFEPSSIKDYAGSVVAAAGNIGVGIGSVVFITFFFLKEEGLFVNFLAALLPSQYDSQVQHAFEGIAKNLSLYFRGLLIQMLSFSFIVTIALLLLGVKNALLIGVLAGLLNVIPYIGPIIGAIFGVILTVSSNLDLEFYTQIVPLIIKVLAVIFGTQMIDNNFLQPVIFSKALKTHPLEIFFVVLMGAKIGGVMGMVLAIPGYTVLRVVAVVFLSEFHVVHNLMERVKKKMPADSDS